MAYRQGICTTLTNSLTTSTQQWCVWCDPRILFLYARLYFIVNIQCLWFTKKKAISHGSYTQKKFFYIYTQCH